MIGAAPWGAFVSGLVVLGGLLAVIETGAALLRQGARVAAGQDLDQ